MHPTCQVIPIHQARSPILDEQAANSASDIIRVRTCPPRNHGSIHFVLPTEHLRRSEEPSWMLHLR